jgi:surface antigen
MLVATVIVAVIGIGLLALVAGALIRCPLLLVLVLVGAGAVILHPWDTTPLTPDGDATAALAAEETVNAESSVGSNVEREATLTLASPPAAQSALGQLPSAAAPAPPGIAAAAPARPVYRGSRQILAANTWRAQGLGDQCTSYAADRMYTATGLWIAAGGNAGEWGRTAREAGWTVGTKPAVRSILVMPHANGYTYSVYAGGHHSRTAVHPEYGHVAWVERLDASGSWALVSDQNWDYHGTRGARWIWLKGAPVQFIYSDR